MAGEEPPFLPVGTEVSAKYRGAFCEAKVKKVVKTVKCKVTIAETKTQFVVSDEDVRGPLKSGARVEVKHPDTGQPVEAIFNKLSDCSMYTVVFDDGDENTLRRTQLCLKGEKHFVKSETLDQLPLTHPEHFGTPVMKHLKGQKRRRTQMSGAGPDESDSDSGSDSSEGGSPRKRMYRGRLQDLIGRVLCMEVEERKKKLWVPVLVTVPTASEVDLKTKDHILVKSFKDGRFYAIAKKDTKEFTRDMAIKNEDKTLKCALEKALLYYDTREIPSSWAREELLGTTSDEDLDTDTSDDEPSEEKDHFVAQLYKFMDDRDTPINKAPAIGAQDLNLYRLFRVVRNLGGYNKVTNVMKWPLVYHRMNLPNAANAATLVKSAYKKFLHAYEDFYRKLGSTMGTRPGRTRHSSGRGIISYRGRDSVAPKSPRSERKEERREDIDKVEEKEDRKKEKEKEKKEEEKAKVKDTEKGKEQETKVKKEEKKSLAIINKEEADVEVDSPRKSRSRTAVEKKAEEKKKEEEEKVTKRVTREDTAKMKDEKTKSGKDDERERRSKGKAETKAEIKTEGTEEKEDGQQKKRSTTSRKKVPRTDESKEDERKSSSSKDDQVSDGGPDDDLDDGGDEEDEPPTKEESRIKENIRKRDLPVGTKLKVKYGRGRNQKIYEAKVIEGAMEGYSMHYLVHYAGWNNRYDEWVQRDRIMAVVDGPEVLEKKATKARLISPKGSAVKSKQKRLLPPGTSPKGGQDTKGSKSKTSTPTPTNQKSRPTRSTSLEAPQALALPKRRSRRSSGYTENSDLQSHESESEDESVEDRLEKPETDTDADSTKQFKADIKSQKDDSTKPKSPQKSTQKSPSRKEEKQEMSDFSDYDSEVESFIKDLKQKKSEMKEKAKVKNDSSGRETGSRKFEEPSGEQMEVETAKKVTAGKSPGVKATKQLVKMTPTKVEKQAESPQSDDIDVDEDIDMADKNKDAQSDDGILKDLRENHNVHMDDLLIDMGSDIPLATTPSKAKGKKDSGKGKRRKSTDSTDKTMRQDSMDTVAYGFDIQDAVQNILDQLDDGSDGSDDLPFLHRETKEVLKIEAEKRDETKTDRPKKPKTEKPKGKVKKAEKVTVPEELKPELEFEKEKKPESEKKRKEKKKKKVKKKEEKEFDKSDIPEQAMQTTDIVSEKEAKPQTIEPVTSTKEPAMLSLSAVESKVPKPPALVEEPVIVSNMPVQGDKEDGSKGEGSGLALSPAPPTLQAVRLEPNISEAEEEERPAPLMEALSPAPLPLIVDMTAPPVSPTPQPAALQLQPSEPAPRHSDPAALPKSPSVTPAPQPAPTPAPSDKSSIAVTDRPITPTSTTVLDNTPPDTPEGSPESVPAPTSPSHPDPCVVTTLSFVDSSSPTPKVTMPVACAEPQPTTSTKEPQTVHGSSTGLLPGGESPNTCDTSTISNGSDGSSGNVPSSEDSTEGSTLLAGTKRKQPTDEQPQAAKKRKRGPKRSVNTEKGKTVTKHTMSDSDEALDVAAGSNSPQQTEVKTTVCPTATTPNAACASTPSKKSTVVTSCQSPTTSTFTATASVEQSRPPRPSKYNFNLEEGKYLEGEQRISFIVEKLQEIRKIYMTLKAEVACIDRRRKRAKRREKEGTAIALASLAGL